MNKSIWTNNIKLPRFEKLSGDIKTDVLIIGGGLCGLLCAYRLQNAGVDCVVAEADRIACGVSSKSTAKITFLHGLVYSKLVTDMGIEKAEMYLKANMSALAEYEKLCKSIDCDLERRNAYTYSITDRKKIEKEVEVLRRLGVAAEFTNHTELPFEISGAVTVGNQAQFNPLKFISEISKNLNIYENTFIRGIAPHMAFSDSGKITADSIIVATHFPFINKHGMYFLKMYQHRSYVTAIENVQNIEGMYVDESDMGMSFRACNDLLLIGGGGHRTGKRGGNWQELYRFAQKYFPGAEVKYSWAAQDCMSLDKVPYIGRYSKQTPNLYVATGFNKWGISSSMVSSMVLSDMVLGKRNDYAEVFDPSRSMLKPQLFANCLETTANMLTPTVKRCPHLGCALKYNKAEHTWDCSCHGSRFEESGRLIDNPATKDAVIK